LRFCRAAFSALYFVNITHSREDFFLSEDKAILTPTQRREVAKSFFRLGVLASWRLCVERSFIRAIREIRSHLWCASPYCADCSVHLVAASAFCVFALNRSKLNAVRALDWTRTGLEKKLANLRSRRKMPKTARAGRGQEVK
jgi:hypothetical protein